MKLKPTDPVPDKIAEAWRVSAHPIIYCISINLRVENMPVPIIMLMFKNMMVKALTV